MNNPLSRRRFLGSLGAFVLAPLERTEPALILYNANIITVDGRNRRAQAVAIADGRLLAVGSNDEVRGLATGGTKKRDLEGRSVVPGLIDVCGHRGSEVCGDRRT